MFLNVSDILHNTCNDMCQLFAKKLENHKNHLQLEAVTNRCPYECMFFKIICEEVHFSVKSQALDLKTSIEFILIKFVGRL